MARWEQSWKEFMARWRHEHLEFRRPYTFDMEYGVLVNLVWKSQNEPERPDLGKGWQHKVLRSDLKHSAIESSWTGLRRWSFYEYIASKQSQSTSFVDPFSILIPHAACGTQRSASARCSAISKCNLYRICSSQNRSFAPLISFLMPLIQDPFLCCMTILELKSLMTRHAKKL